MTTDDEDLTAEERSELPRTMRYWLARTLREARVQAGQKPKDVAFLASVDPGTLSRFESYKSWPREVDRMVAAYAHLCGVEDGREFWITSARRYAQDGGVPVLGELSAAQRALLLALEAAQRRSPYAGESRGKPTSTRRRRAGG